MRIVFAGTPDFAVPPLRALAAAGHEVALVLSQPDRPSGRGRKVAPTPVREAAEGLGVPVTQPERVKAALEQVKAARPDVLVTAAYGQKVPDSLLAIPRLGGFNVHASILPRHRGAAPVAHAILAGDAESGITIFRMVREMDAGDVLHEVRTPISAAETAGELEARLSQLGAVTIVDALRLLEGGAKLRPQDHTRATLAPKLSRADGAIDWNRPAAEIARRIRAMQPWPVAFAALRKPDASQLRVAILAGAPEEAAAAPPGTILEAGRPGLFVACGQGALRVTRVQPESRKSMSSEEFVNGFRIRTGFSFVNGATAG
jgi:methionyl-tRNA formyltransferase